MTPQNSNAPYYYGYPDPLVEACRVHKRATRLLALAAILFVLAIVLPWIGTKACAQTSPADPNIRALQMVNSELMQAWTSSRAAMLGLQDQLAAAQAEIKDLKEQRSKAEADKAHALPDPGAAK